MTSTLFIFSEVVNETTTDFDSRGETVSEILLGVQVIFGVANPTDGRNKMMATIVIVAANINPSPRIVFFNGLFIF